jgi:hypothetical protein
VTVIGWAGGAMVGSVASWAPGLKQFVGSLTGRAGLASRLRLQEEQRSF